MSKLEKLIEELCPNGVPFIELSKMAEIGTGSSDRKDATENGKYPFYVRSKDILKIAYDTEELYQGYMLKGVVSRKKQMVPFIMDALEG